MIRWRVPSLRLCFKIHSKCFKKSEHDHVLVH